MSLSNPQTKQNDSLDSFKIANWGFLTKTQLDNPPSLLSPSPLTLTEERTMRMRCNLLILSTSSWLNIDEYFAFTAMVYIHRFYTSKRFQDYNYILISVTSLREACRLGGINYSFEDIYEKLFRSDSEIDYQMPIVLDFKRMTFQNCQMIFLKTLDFRLHMSELIVTLPEVCKTLGASPDLVNLSWKVLMFSLFVSPHCILYEPKITACLHIFIAIGQFSTAPPPPPPPSEMGLPWYKRIDESITAEFLECFAQEMQRLTDELQPMFSTYLLSTGLQHIYQ